MKKNDNITYQSWGEFQGKEVFLFKMVNQSGAYVELTNYGASIVSIVVPDQENRPGNVVLNYPNLGGYVHDPYYLGSTVGRFANRIGGARFTLDNQTYHLEKTEKGHSLHGGRNGFNSRIFDFDIEADKLSFTIISKDGEGGYPGNLWLVVTYEWDENNTLTVAYSAISDKNTIANFTNHAYFNLSSGKNNMLGHKLTIRGEKLLETDAEFIPTGSIISAGDKVFQNTIVKNNLKFEAERATGINDYYIFDEINGSIPQCVLIDVESGRKLEVFTSYPGVQVYTGDYLGNGAHGGSPFSPFDGIALECQHYPDSPNHQHFPAATLNAGERYEENIVFKFSVI